MFVTKVCLTVWSAQRADPGDGDARGWVDGEVRGQAVELPPRPPAPGMSGGDHGAEPFPLSPILARRLFQDCTNLKRSECCHLVS